jgi:methionine-rich copper-binding protein CopC
MKRSVLTGSVFANRKGGRRASTSFVLECLEERSLLSTGLVAAYSFDEGTGSTVNDLSGNGNNGTVSNTTWSTSGKFGGALSFNGTSSLVTINDSSSLRLTTGMTLEAWVDPSAVTATWQTVFYKGTAPSDNYYLGATSGDTKAPFAGAVVTWGTEADSNTPLVANNWAFLAATYDGTASRLYVNGAQVATTSGSGNILTSNGALMIGGDIWDHYFSGLIDNVRIYNTALTQAQMQTDMNTAVTGSTTTPAVTSGAPASGATAVATNAGVGATFNEAVLASSITTGNFVLKSSSGSTVTASVGYTSATNTATLTPSSLLANSTTYTATISGVTDAAGHKMASPFSWSFTTGPAPAVTNQSPASGAKGAGVSSPVTATFNEAVQSGTISFTLKNSAGTAVGANVAYNSANYTVTLTPNAALAYSTTYTATVSGAKDTAGDPMSGSVTWSFTTSAQPAVTSHTPASGATGIGVASTVTATFNEAVQSSTIVFSLKNSSGSAVTTALAYNASTNTATWTPSAALASATTYTATVSGAKDTAGDPMSGSVTWSFTTSAQPAITSYTPASGATGIGVASTVTAKFSEAVQQSTIVFSLKNSSGTAVTTALAYNSSTNTATWTPGAALAYSTTYTATVSGAKDTAGNPMSGSVTWSFTTSALPAVTSHTPASSATGIGVASTVTATFNEAVQLSTIVFSLKNSSGSAVTTALSYNSSTNTATWIPSAALAYSTTYTATVSGAKDTAGDPMSGSVTWSFTTSAQPAVTGHTPASGATGVAVGSTVTATFNEAVQPSTIVFSLKNSSGTAVTTTFAYNSSTNTATWTPSAALAYFTTYTATVSGAKDTAGDPMNGSVTWSFTTVLLPTVTSETPASGGTTVATNTGVTATFIEAVLATSITTGDFVLKSSSGSTVSASVGYTVLTNTATLTPSSLLANSTTYTATISGVIDLLGHIMPSPFSWSFTTGPAPAVTTKAPASGATGVAVSSPLTATFNEAVQSGTINFTLKNSSGTAVGANVAYNSANYTVTLTPNAALAYSTTYTATVSGAKDTAGDPMSGAVTWSFTTGAAPGAATMVLQNFNGPTLPTDGDGDTYPSQYTSDGTATVSLNSTNSVTGNSVQFNVTSGAFYAQFNSFNYADNPAYPPWRSFMRDYSQNPSGWQYNTYNRISFWYLRPTTAGPMLTNGDYNVEIGTYDKQITNEDNTSDETGGDHYYHLLNLPATGQWTQVILNMHPDHYRGEDGSQDPGVVTYPTATNGPNGGDDPPGTYNYFDTMTRLYIDEEDYPANGTFLVDDFQFYNEPVQENDVQAYSLTATYNPSNNELITTWNHDKNDGTIDDVRYAFSDIHQLGWASATPAPNGIITPPDAGAYNAMWYDTTSLPLSGHSVVYIAVKPENSNLFTEIAVPIYGVGQHPSPVSEIFGGSGSSSMPLNATTQVGTDALTPATKAAVTGTLDNQAAVGSIVPTSATTIQQGQAVPQGPRVATKAKPEQPPQFVFQSQVTGPRIVVNDSGAGGQPKMYGTWNVTGW